MPRRSKCRRMISYLGQADPLAPSLFSMQRDRIHHHHLYHPYHDVLEVLVLLEPNS